MPAIPTPAPPSGDQARQDLWDRVQEALRAVPLYFSSKTYIEGLEAGDLFNLNGILGSTIEIQVVETLNRMRKLWDPDDEWLDYRFERSAQTFPDVRLLRRSAVGITIALGIELKGWYLLAKEGEPSLRYKVTPAACSDWDLVAVVPWHLTNVLSGVPIVFEPYIEQARYLAEYRNYWWQYIRDAHGNVDINPPPVVIEPYPAPKTEINDRPVNDSGRNFGRIARIGVMDEYVNTMLRLPVSGIEAQHWVGFFKAYTESGDREAITRQLEATLAQTSGPITEESATQILTLLQTIKDFLD